jgi:hypothetical protein
LPDAVAVPTVVPPVEQLVGAEDSGPKTLKVIVPVGLEPLAKALETAVGAMVVPAVPPAGPVAETVGLALPTTVLDIADPQVLAAVLLFVSPPYEAYHQ